uniref:Coiled-coil domain-containing protein 97 n=1 Tax=Rhizophora mucronata TaxID=61149 RepID=A0A2P2K691_RHIMU
MEVRVGKEAMERITERLSVMEGLYFPHAVPSNVATVSQHKFLLLHLLSRDVAIFLGTLSFSQEFFFFFKFLK